MPSLTITEEAFANDPESTQQQLEMVDCDVGGLLSEEGRDLLRSTTELDYLTHLVFRLYENKAVPADAPGGWDTVGVVGLSVVVVVVVIVIVVVVVSMFVFVIVVVVVFMFVDV